MNLDGYATHLNQTHLNQAQIDDHLIGDPAPLTAEHLAQCDLCVARVAEAAAPIEAFRRVSLAWSERRSATLPLHQAIAGWGARWGRRSSRSLPRVAWAAAVAAALAVGMAIPVVAHQQRQETARAHLRIPLGTVAANNSSDQIVRDNQMLQAIDRELDAAADNPEALGLKPVSGTPVRKALPSSSMQD